MEKSKEDCTEPKWKGYIRPFGFVSTLLLFFVLMITDGNFGSFHVREAYLPILETLLVTITIALYGSRGIEKTARTLTKKEQE